MYRGFKAHRLVYHSTLGSRVIKKKKKKSMFRVSGFGFRASGVGFRASGVGSRVSGLGSRVSGLGSRASGLGFRASCFVSGFGLRDEG